MRPPESKNKEGLSSESTVRGVDGRNEGIAADLRLRVVNTPELDALADDWRVLERAADTSVFQSWLWIHTWLRHVPEGAAPRLLEWRIGRDLIGLGIFCERPDFVLHRFPNRALLLHDTGYQDSNFVIEYNGLLVKPGYEEAVSASLLDYFLYKSPSSEMVLNGIRCDDKLLAQARGNGSVWLDEVNTSPSRYVDLGALRATGTEFLNTLSRNSRYQIRKQLRQLEKIGGLSTECAESPEQALQFLDELKVHHQQYWRGLGQPGSFAKPAWEAFHRDLIRAGQPSGSVQLLRFMVGDKVLGYLYNLVHEGKVAMLQSGFNYPEFAANQPGYVCNVLAIEYNLTLGMKSYDLLAGDAQYKRSLAKDAVPLCWVSVRKRTIKNRVENCLLRIYRKIRARNASA